MPDFCGIPIRTQSQVDIDEVAVRFGHQFAFDVVGDEIAWIKYAYDHATGNLYIIDSGSVAATPDTPTEQESK